MKCNKGTVWTFPAACTHKACSVGVVASWKKVNGVSFNKLGYFFGLHWWLKLISRIIVAGMKLSIPLGNVFACENNDHYLPSAVFIANKGQWGRANNSNNHNMIRIPTGRRQAICLFIRMTEELNQEQPQNNPTLWPERDLNPGSWILVKEFKLNSFQLQDF